MKSENTNLSFKQENKRNKQTTGIEVVVEEKQGFVIINFRQSGRGEDRVQGHEDAWHHSTRGTDQGEVDLSIDTHVETDDHDQQRGASNQTGWLAEEGVGKDDVEHNRQRAGHIVYKYKYIHKHKQFFIISPKKYTKRYMRLLESKELTERNFHILQANVVKSNHSHENKWQW